MAAAKIVGRKVPTKTSASLRTKTRVSGVGVALLLVTIVEVTLARVVVNVVGLGVIKLVAEPTIVLTTAVVYGG